MDDLLLDKIVFTRVLNPKYHGNLIGGLHAHKNDYQLIYVERGAGVLVIEDNEYKVSSNDLICILPNQLHCSQDEDQAFFELIEILWYFKDPIQPELKLQPVVKLTKDSEIVQCLHRLVEEALVRHSNYQLMMKILLGQTLLYLQRIEPQAMEKMGRYFSSYQRQKVKRAIDYIHLNYQEDIRLADLAERAGVSNHYLCRLFKKYTSYTPINYLIKIRLDIAIDLLKNSDYNISEIAEMVGFEDVYYFSRLFKKRMGISPSHFLKQ